MISREAAPAVKGAASGVVGGLNGYLFCKKFVTFP